MEQSKRKRLIEFASLAFVTVIFISSYLTFGNNNVGGNSTTSTISNAPTFFAAGYVNATVTGYGSSAYVTLPNVTNATEAAVSGVLSSLESNGTASFNNLNSTFQIYLNDIDAYSLQQLLVNATGEGNVMVRAPVKVSLPADLTLYYNSAAMPVHLSQLNYTLTIVGLKPVGAHVNVSVHALITHNGSVYNNMIRLNSS